jgi:uncharacterized membrane protein
MFGRKPKPSYKSHPLAVFALLTVVVFLARKLLKKALRNHRTRIARSEPFPYLDSVSLRQGCDIEGLRFLAGALGAFEINQALGCQDAQDPIRVYAGLGHGANAQERVRYALDEMERLGGFERRFVMVVSPTGRGYVHPIPAETAELITHGDVAIVAVQYHDDQTLRAVRKLDQAADAHRLLVQELVQRMPAKVCVYGESLGAWASQEALVAVSDATLGALHAGVWAGTPYASSQREALSRRLDSVSGLCSLSSVASADELARGQRFVMLTNPDDPIAYFNGMSVLYKPASWTRHLNRRWVPGVTFARAVLEVEAATRPTPGIRESRGHDYRASVARVLARAWLGDGFDPAAHESVEKHLTERERTRRARMAFLHAAVSERE